MQQVQFNTQLTVKTTLCITCGIVIALPDEFYDRRLFDHRGYFCPNGHEQHFTAESEEERLKRELTAATKRLEFERQQRVTAEQQAKKAREDRDRLKRRIAKGVCPCCQRTVSQLARHMKSKHPDYTGA